MKARYLVLLLAPLAPIAAFASSRWVAAHHTPWNVVLISIDTLRADHLSAYGYHRPTSPEIEKIAARGILFAQAFSNAPKTAPSHMTLLTGMLPDAHGVDNFDDLGNHALPIGIPTLASTLREHGYRTAAITAGGQLVAELGFDRGQDSFELRDGAQAIFERAEEKIREFGKSPFCLFVHTYAVHDPYSPPAPYCGMWSDPEYSGRVPIGAEALTAAAGKDWNAQHDVFWQRVDASSTTDIHELEALYDGSIRMVDGLVGHLIGELRARGELERTLVVFVGDHGEEFQDHGDFLHESVYQEVLHVPLVIVPPSDGILGPMNGLRGRRVASPVSLVDVMPTVLDVLGLDAPDHLEGRSLLPVARGEEADERVVLSDWPRAPLYALRHERWKLIYRPATAAVDEYRELYDLVRDPRETHDVSRQYPWVCQELRQELRERASASREFLARHGGVGPSVEVDAERRRQLEALGYMGSEPDTSTSSEPDSPTH